MNSSTSTLNPYAQAYIPLAHREVKNEDEDYKTLSGRATFADDDLKLKGQQVDVPHGVQTQNLHEIDEESEMDLAYLQMIFPGVCDQSLIDVYTVNRGDLEAAVDMLSDLESADHLPEALDIGGIQETVPSGECTSVKVSDLTGESSTSSGSSDLTIST